MIFLPQAQKIFGTVSLSGFEIAVIIIVTSSIMFFNDIQKAAINAEIREREKMEIHNNSDLGNNL